MTKLRPAVAATFALALLGGGIAASGGASARPLISGKTTAYVRTTLPPFNNNYCINGVSQMGGGVCQPGQRTKNAALPTTTKPKTVTSPVPTIKPRVKNGIPKSGATTGTTCSNVGCPTKPRKG